MKGLDKQVQKIGDTVQEWKKGRLALAAYLDKEIPVLVAQAVQEALAKQKDITEKYNELIMAVGRKYEGETRHETALKYIKQAENNVGIGAIKDSTKEETK